MIAARRHCEGRVNDATISGYQASAGRRALVVAGEMTLTVALVFVYLVLRGAVGPDDPAGAVSRTLAAVRFEQAVGLFREPAWQRAILGHRALVEIANAVYLFGMHPVMLGAGVWLCVRDREWFRFVRRVLVVSAVIGVLCYWLLPAAPPRLLAENGHSLGFVDTLRGDVKASVQDMQPAPLVNDYAAIPSYHFAWILLMAVAIWTATRNVWARGLAACFCAVMWWAIAVTGNHLFFDMALGVVAVALSWVITLALDRAVARLRPTTLRRAPAGAEAEALP
jgi:hypothetical protein